MERSKSKKNLSERALGIIFGGYGGLWGTERRPGELQGGLQELQSYDPWSLSSDYEPSRSRWQPQRAPKEFLESQNEAQSSTEELHKAFRELRERSEDQKRKCS